uniref:Uncharacterized protein n=1 Tax=Graphocephala atropunctata TaxID=36148 RepID=A0A1B6ML23_9HEMI
MLLQSASQQTSIFQIYLHCTRGTPDRKCCHKLHHMETLLLEVTCTASEEHWVENAVTSCITGNLLLLGYLYYISHTGLKMLLQAASHRNSPLEDHLHCIRGTLG